MIVRRSYFYTALTKIRIPHCSRGKFLLLSLTGLAVLASPALANAQCSTLGLRTVNWKSPDINETGVLIVDVYSDCVAARLGVHTGQFITGFNGKAVTNKYDLENLAGNHGADQAFSITLKDSDEQTQTLNRDALPVLTVDEAVLPAPAEISGEWLSWFAWAGFFLVLSLTLSPLMGWILLNHAQAIALGGGSGSCVRRIQTRRQEVCRGGG